MIKRLILLFIALVLSWVAAHYGEPYVRGNSDAIVILVTIFTVFAGFMVAIVTILGDPALIPPGSWRVAELRRDTVATRLFAHMVLFIIYLVTIILLFAGIVVQKAPPLLVPEIAKIWIGRAYLFLGVFSFLLTFMLPKSLMNLQLMRYDAETDRRMKEAGIKDEEEKAKGGQKR